MTGRSDHLGARVGDMRVIPPWLIALAGLRIIYNQRSMAAFGIKFTLPRHSSLCLLLWVLLDPRVRD